MPRKSAPIFFSLGKENGRGRSKEKRFLRGLDSPEVWRVSAACPARRAAGGCCRPQQPSDSLRRKGFPQPLAAAVRCMKEHQSPKIRPASGAPLWVRCSGQGLPIKLQAPSPTGGGKVRAAGTTGPWNNVPLMMSERVDTPAPSHLVSKFFAAISLAKPQKFI